MNYPTRAHSSTRTAASTPATPRARNQPTIGRRPIEDPNRRGLAGAPTPNRVCYPALTPKLHVTPNWSVSMPKPGLQAEAASGSTMVA